ncbi:unnamed protein product [Ilex paraguariensis]|uniref:Aminotransferase class V domain-containing protein n=1 Tax=Ilex paraguariensis TaxID=185542 RepID=A0ABC8T886_9AQUA
MEFEVPTLRYVQRGQEEGHSWFSTTVSSPPGSADDLTPHLIEESFHIVEKGVPESECPTEKKLSWLRSQIIGRDSQFDTPLGKRRLTYADHTASGQCLHYIENYIINKVLPSYGNSHTSDSYVGHKTTKTVHEASKYVKKCLGGSQDDALIFCGSGTTAAIKRLQEVMGIAISSKLREKVLSILSNIERWVVFVGPYEHHSNILSWRQSLAEVIEIGLDENGLLDMNALRLQLNFYQCENRPMLGSFSACSNVTGIYSDTRALACLLHQYGGFACFDFAASGPYVEINMRSGEIDGYDAVFLSPHKFLGGPGSPGILLMNKALYQLKDSAPSTCGGGTVDFVNGFNEKASGICYKFYACRSIYSLGTKFFIDLDTLYSKNIEEREDAGTPPIIQKIRTALAFWVKEYIGHKQIERQEDIYIERALARLLPNPNIWILGNTSAKRLAILSFLVYSTTYIPSVNTNIEENLDGEEITKGLYLWRETGNKRDKPLHGPFVASLLNDLFGIQARGGCACAGPYGHRLLNVDESRSLAFKAAIQMGYNGMKPGWTRISFPYYMSNEEFEFILAALEFTAIYGQRFLPLYHFNWKTGSWTFKKKMKEKLQRTESGLVMASLKLASEIECNELRKHNDTDIEGVGVIYEYAVYLETAKRIASFLPKFPPRRRIPKDIDLDLMPFRV